MRKLLLILIPLLALPALPGVAGAHVEVSPVKAPAAKPVKLRFAVGHGCDGAATIRLIARIPEGVTAVRPLPAKGWKSHSTGREVIWSGGPLGDHDRAEFPFKATLSGEKGDRIPFKVIQRCEGGKETAWIQVGGEGRHDSGGEADSPAPVVTLTSTGDVLDAADDSGTETEPAEPGASTGATGEADTGAAPADQASAEPDSDDDGGGSSAVRIAGLVLIVAAVTAWIVMRRNRSKG